MKCFECGKGSIRRKKTLIRAEMRGVKLEIPGVAEECDHCGFQAVPIDQANRFGCALDAAYRKAANLLTKERIRTARQSLKMNQREFAEYLGVGEASVKRWEVGAIQDKSSDNLIRQMTDPEYARMNLEQLCKRLGQTSPTAPSPVTVVRLGQTATLPRPSISAWQPVSETTRKRTLFPGYSKAEVLN